MVPTQVETLVSSICGCGRVITNRRPSCYELEDHNSLSSDGRGCLDSDGARWPVAGDDAPDKVLGARGDGVKNYPAASVKVVLLHRRSHAKAQRPPRQNRKARHNLPGQLSRWSAF